jgi:hypothetical protein
MEDNVIEIEKSVAKSKYDDDMAEKDLLEFFDNWFIKKSNKNIGE